LPSSSVQSCQISNIHIATWRLKARIEDSEVTAVNTLPRQPNHVTVAMDTQATIKELIEAVFSFWSAPRLHNEDPSPAETGWENLKSETVQYDFESRGTRTQQ
jgi:hypothetical protein